MSDKPKPPPLQHIIDSKGKTNAAIRRRLFQILTYLRGKIAGH